MSRFTRDHVSFVLFGACALCAGVILSLILFFLFTASLDSIDSVGVWRFFTDEQWSPEHSAEDGVFGMVPMLVGTLLTSAVAVLIAIPLGVFSALFIQFYAPTYMARVYQRMIELLAGVPSVVYGFWGLVVLVPVVQEFRTPGLSVLTGALVLAMMILPLIVLMSISAIAAAHQRLQFDAAALGFSEASYLYSILLPTARRGIAVGVLLAAARALGETMVVVMLCGNVVQLPESLFDPVRTLTGNIALEMAYAFGAHRSSLFFSGLLLMSMVLLLLGAAKFARAGASHE